MANATKVPLLSEFVVFQWSRPDAPNPRLAAPLTDKTTDTLVFTNPPLDESGNVVTEAFLMGVKDSNSYVETIYVPAGALSADGLTATGVIRGVDPSGIDFTTGSTDFATDSAGVDAPVFCNITAVYQSVLVNALQGVGDMATGGLNLVLGDETNSTVTVKHARNGSVIGWLRKNDSLGKVQFSNDGTVWTNIDSVTASNLVEVSADDTTPGDLETKLVAGTNTTVSVNNPGGNETIQVNAAGTLANIVTDVTATSTEINQALDGISANVTNTNLDTLTGGPASNADALHTHENFGVQSLTSGEAIDGSTTPQLLSYGTSNFRDTLQVHNGGTDTDYDFDAQLGTGGLTVALNLGETAAGSNRQAQSFTYTNTLPDTVTIRKVRVFMEKASAPTDNLQVLIMGDDSSKPDDVTITNGSSGTVAGSSLQNGDMQWVEFTFSTPPEITIGDKYWFVLDRSAADDATNYYVVMRRTSDAYSGHGVSTYNASLGTWGAQSANDLVFQIEFGLDMGDKVYKFDANDMLRGNAIGFTEDNQAADTALAVIPFGQPVSGFSTLTSGAPHYASTTAGAIVDSDSFSMASNQIMCPVGKAASATVLNSFVGEKIFYAAIDNLDASEGTSQTADFTFLCGFRPIRFELRYYSASSTAQDDEYAWVEQIDTFTIPNLSIQDLDTETVISTVTDVKQDSGSNKIRIQEVFDNGVTIRATTDSAHQITLINIIAYGY